MNKYIAAGIIVVSVLIASVAFSHSGGTNEDGCHAGSKPYHCHNAKKHDCDKEY